MSSPDCIVCTGKLGDILNILPLCKSIADEQGSPVPVLSAAQYADVLDGVSYVKKHVFDGNWLDLKAAMAEARKQYKNVKVWQIAGPKEVTDMIYREAGLNQGDSMTESFIKEQWRVAGWYYSFRKNWPLVFDQRDSQREAALLKHHGRSDVLIHLGGDTSPHPCPKLLKNYLERSFKILDLSEVRAERFYDMLAFYERAKVLVTIDSAPLHLAQACPNLKVVALQQDKPSLWHGACWRPNHVMTIRYSDLDRIIEIPERITWELQQLSNLDSNRRKLIHVYSDYWRVSDEHHNEAKKNWEHSFKGENCHRVTVDYCRFGRDSRAVFHGEGPRFPYVKDVIRNAVHLGKDDDWVLLTRPETCVRWGNLKAVANSMDQPLVVGCRCLIKDGGRPEDAVPQMINDLWLFTVKWWRENQNGYPDLVMGTEQSWAEVLARFLAIHGAPVREDVCYRKAAPDIPIIANNYRGYNQKIANDWLTANEPPKGDPTEQILSRRINPMSLFRHGYNPYVFKYNSGYLCAYRAHRWNDLRTCLAIAELDDSFNVRNNQWVEPKVPDLSTEDPKLFWFNGRLFMSYVRSHWPKDPQNCNVHYGEIARSEDGWTFTSHYSPKPSFMRKMEKNWVFFEHNGKLLCSYQLSPHYQLLEIEGDEVVKVYPPVSVPEWKWGPIRGGAPPILHNGKWIKIVHSASWHLPPPVPHCYYLGAIEVDPEHKVAPFAPVSLSKKPIAEGCRHDHVSKEEGRPSPHYKANILFPGSLWESGEAVNISLGFNDCESWIMALKDVQLNL